MGPALRPAAVANPRARRLTARDARRVAGERPGPVQRWGAVLGIWVLFVAAPARAAEPAPTSGSAPPAVPATAGGVAAPAAVPAATAGSVVAQGSAPAAVPAAAGSAVAQGAAPAAGSAAAQAAAPAARLPAATYTGPAQGVVLWAAAPGEPIPPALAQALAKQQLAPAPGGALRAAGAAVAVARRAVLELKCSEAIPALDAAASAALAEVSLPEARPVLSEAYGLMLLCADRLNDREHCEKASAALTAMQAPLPPDVALVLSRYSAAAQVPFGPPRAPVRVETDPPGAVVARNLIPVGVTPLAVPGGNPAFDVLDVEMPGMRKVRRPLGSGAELVLSLRPEDRPGVLLDRAAQLPLGSDEQAAVLRQLAEAPQTAATLPSRRVVVVGPKERAGAPVAEEPLIARIYDLDRKQWSSGKSDVAIGPPPVQASRLVALLTVAGPTAPPPSAAKAAGAPAAVAAAKPEKPPEKPASGFKLAFGKTKWYTWVIAGGVVALLAGVLIADKVSSDKVTVTATH